MSGLIRFRWIAILSMCVGILPLFRWGFLPIRSLFYFLAVVALLALFNVFAMRRLSRQPTSPSSQVLIHLYVDLFAVAGLLFVSGSANNPFVGILCVHAFLGGMLLKKKSSTPFAVVLFMLLGILQYETYQDASVTLGIDQSELFLRFLSQWVLIVASWFVSHYFSSLLARKEERIRFLQDRQHQSDRLKALGALTAGFSHRLATPMNSLKLRMDRGIRKWDEPAIAKEEFDKAQGALEKCIEVFEQMASVFSHSEQSELQTISLEKLVPELLRAWEKENPDAKVQMSLPQENLTCRLNVLSFSHAFFDILNNAKEASDRADFIFLRLFRESSWIYLEIVDSGEGLSEEILRRLGEPFVTSKVGGNGLGIYSAHMMAQACGGEFKIYNNLPRPGATVEIKLPLDAGENADVGN